MYAATSKLLDYETFTLQLAQSPLLSAYAGIIAWSVPGLEILIAVFLVLPRFRKIGLYASFFLMVLFTTYIYIILNYADFVPCSCGGVLEEMTWGQHLLFNFVFILMAAGAILLDKPKNLKTIWLLLCLLSLISIGTVTLLFSFSENKMHRNNAFQRRYIPHPIKKINSYDLKYSSYYFAGIGKDKVYLGNTTAPLLMTVIDSDFTDTTTTMIQLDQMELPYRAVKVRVVPPKFYVADGTVPVLLKGAIKDWKATTSMHGNYYFNSYQPTDSNHIAVRSSSSSTGENILGLIELGNSIQGTFSDTILEKQIDGIFDTDGLLVYNPAIKKLVYIYYYRNEYIIIDKTLRVTETGKTIDTVSKAQMHIAQNQTNDLKKLGGNTLLINRTIATTGNLLFVESPRLGKLEPEDMLDEAAVIDVYDLKDQSYRFSFYLYDHRHSKLREFTIKNNILYALQGNYIIAYKLEKKHFE